MLHLFLCFSVWTLIFVFLCWRLIAIAMQANNHLQQLHRIPCSKCDYFTGDYRLKCTVNPIVAMSEAAIDCRDFASKRVNKHNNFPRIKNPKTNCGGCFAVKGCSNSADKSHKSKLPVFAFKLNFLKPKFSYINHEDIPLSSTSLD